MPPENGIEPRPGVQPVTPTKKPRYSESQASWWSVAKLSPQRLIQVLLVAVLIWFGTVFREDFKLMRDDVKALGASVGDLSKAVNELRLETVRRKP